MAAQLAYLGLGNIGQAMAKNLVRKGKLEKPLILWNRTTSRATSICSQVANSAVVNTPEDAVISADIIFSCLADETAVFDTFNAMLKQDVKGKLFVECSTISPENTDKLSQKVEEAGATFVAMPVFGEPSMAEKGLLTCVLAGSAEQVEKVKLYCVGVIGKAVIDFSDEKPGKASLLKITGNLLIVNMIESIAETLVFAEKTGLGSGNLQKLIAAVFPGPYMIYSQRMTTGGYCQKEPLVGIGMAQHLASEVLALANQAGASLKAYEVAAKHMDEVWNQVGDKGDLAGIYGVVRRESGLEF